MDYGARAADRLTLFSDAVVAIAITLLAIDLPVPEGPTVSVFLSSVRHNGDHYAAFLVSLGAVDRRPAGGFTVAPYPPPQAEPRRRPSPR